MMRVDPFLVNWGKCRGILSCMLEMFLHSESGCLMSYFGHYIRLGFFKGQSCDFSILINMVLHDFDTFFPSQRLDIVADYNKYGSCSWRFVCLKTDIYYLVVKRILKTWLYLVYLCTYFVTIVCSVICIGSWGVSQWLFLLLRWGVPSLHL